MRIFVDLDGVLADFDEGAMAALGMHPRDFEQLHGANLFWKRLSETPDFYDRLRWMPEGRELWELVCAVTYGKAPPRILTGLPLGDWAEPQKRSWCRRELGAHIPVIACRSIDKHRYCSAGDVLIDDRVQNGLDWTTAGGVFIHHVNVDRTIAALHDLRVAEVRPVEVKVDEREDAATEKRIADMDAELRHGADMAKSGFVDVRELAAIVYEADRRLQMADGVKASPHWLDATEQERSRCEDQVRECLLSGKTPAPTTSMELARVQLMAGIVGALRDFTRA